ncbi:LPS-assembly protein LptD [Ramlibacter sp. G-1-2-2]|uniref:LPS-assembly protein LptD n=1 Tax=Ramlibacter agri TaxID=2728837 RepID=A0A848GZ39_9BURK|nr:LPS-assembly protein LptD [Ramlibacter agri]NML42569.1 LPS-assembly protein LptD [Ramlibacter agri]
MHYTRFQASRARFALTPVAFVAAALLPLATRAQEQPEAAPQLKPSPVLRENIPADVRPQLPTFVEGDAIRGQTDVQTEVQGNAVLRKGDTIIRADKLEYNTPKDLATATGNVHINKAGTIYEGPFLELEVDAFHGFFNEPRYHFLRNDAYGEAERVDFEDDKHSIIHRATYTTCQRRPGPDWMPDWILKADKITLDDDTDTGVATGAVLSFFRVPILGLPAMSFPLTDQRKSGVLPPTIGLDNKSGVEVTVPYYWNIAPNRDATIYPTLMSKRGVDLGGEFRYLEPSYNGIFRGDILPNDKLRDMDRWGYTYQHTQSFAPAGGALGGGALALNLNRVSDDNYWRDFSRNSSVLTQRLLAADGTLSWGIGDLSVFAREQKWQTLQDATAPILPPYDRSPQVQARYVKNSLPAGFESTIEADTTRFTRTLDPIAQTAFAATPESLQPNGQRTYGLLQLSRPWQAPGWFFVPKAQVHAAHYDLDATSTANGRTEDRVIPTFSLDGGLVFERNTSYFGRAFLQTLEPRAFYTYTPFRDQTNLPNYDSALNDFNFATIWTENAFGGNDRISDGNLLTLGATSRLLDPDTGAEAAKFGIAQRVRFKDQLVTLPGGTPVSERLSDLLFGVSANLVPSWSVDSTVEYNPKTNRSIRSTIGARYSPKNYHVITAAYRLNRIAPGSEQMDVGWQWPLNDLWGDKGQELGPGRGEGEGRWYSVGRMNYDMQAKKLVDAVVGLEYDAGCWIGRVVVERLQAGTTQANKRVLFQIEFVGLSRLGSNALQSLKENIPRYQFLREQVLPPSRFSNYD